ncbi:MAG: amino acid permease [Betaproteobacteria bacterium]|nr:amino acid permease [Betaproteobacteria bacterium]
MKSLFRTKSLESIIESAKNSQLKKSLGIFDLIFIGIGSIIGTGIFVLTGQAAANYAGPAISISFFLAALVCIFAGLAYAELASMIPISGSAYTYTYGIMGEFIAWLVACGLILEYTVASSTVSAGWSGYLVGILQQSGVIVPEYLTKAPSQICSDQTYCGIINLPAVFISSFIGLLLFIGTKESVMINRILVSIKLIVIFIFLIVATPIINTQNYANFMPFGWNGIFTGAAAIFFAYLGFDAVATTAEECKDPKKDLPIGIIGSLLICAVIYILVSLALTGIAHYSTLNNPQPLAFALRENGKNIGSALVGTGAIAGMVTVLLVMMYGQSRVFFAISRDGLLPKFFTKTHSKYQTPYISVAITTVSVVLISGFTPIKTMGDMSSIGTLFAFLIVSIGVVILRITNPQIKRSFKCPAVFLVSTLSVLGCGFLIYKLLIDHYLPFVIWFVIGIIFYAIYGYKNSKLNQQ